MSEISTKKTGTLKCSNNVCKPLRFEDNLKRLEDITTVLERGELDLEESIKYFREGSALYKQLKSELDKTEGEVKLIMENLEGKLTEKELNQ
jgi:exodeoxyribonuclease VII small subunit